MSHNDLINSTAESFIEQLDELFSDSKNTKGYQKRKDDIIELFKEAINNAIEEVEKESKTKTKKSKTGTGKKRGPSGYNIFIKKRMPELKNFSDAAAEWKTMTKEQKQPFNDEAKQRKTKTDDEHEEETSDTDKKKKSEKKKRTPSGYNLFMREQNAIYKEKGEKGNHMKDIATTWKALSDEKKKTYNNKAKTQTTDSEKKSKTESDHDVTITSEDEQDTKSEDSKKTQSKKPSKKTKSEDEQDTKTKKTQSKKPSKKSRKNESSDDEE
jgi:hypothetical protein